MPEIAVVHHFDPGRVGVEARGRDRRCRMTCGALYGFGVTETATVPLVTCTACLARLAALGIVVDLLAVAAPAAPPEPRVVWPAPVAPPRRRRKVATAPVPRRAALVPPPRPGRRRFTFEE
jgi:hypothetical protein